MTPRDAGIAIVGAGLSGLYAACRLERLGIRDYIVLEARDTHGGRIASFGADGVDLGPAWYWPDYQPALDGVIRELGLRTFAQHETGDTMIERSPTEPPLRVRGYVNMPASLRLHGGMAALADALRRGLDASRIVTGHAVRRLRRIDRHVELDAQDHAGNAVTWRARHVLLALPPRLAAHTIAFEPALPPALAADWRATPTWMASHAKYVALYDRPFWRALGLSGEGRSARVARASATAETNSNASPNALPQASARGTTPHAATNGNTNSWGPRIQTSPLP